MISAILFFRVSFLRRALIVSLWFALFPNVLQAADLVWTNNSGGTWNNPANWSPNQVPGPLDSATFNSGVTVTVSAAATVSNFTFSAGTLAATSPLTIAGTMSWINGTISSGSTLNIAASGTLNLTNSSLYDLPGSSLNNAGNIVWSAGSIRGGTGTIINNIGLWNVQADISFGGSAYGGISTFTNTGTIRKSVTPGQTSVSGVALYNSGTMDIQTGTLDLQSGLIGSGNFSGAGAIQLSGVVNATMNGTANWSGGTITAGSLLTLNGVFGWSGGTMSGSTLTITPASTVTVSNQLHDLPGSVMNNSGTILWVSGQIRGGGTVINNSGLWNVQTDDNLGGNVYGGSSTFTNSGTFRKSVTPGTATLTGISMANFGTVDVLTGTIGLNGGFFGNGTFSGGGAVQLNGTVNATMSGTANWSGGTINSGSSLNINGAVNWSGGNISGSALNVTANGTFTVSASSTHDLPGTVFSNAGTVLWTGGQIRGGVDSVFINTGLWNVQCDDVISGNVFGGNSTFTNSGTFRKSTATGVTTVNSTSFNNTGTVDVQTGTVNLSGGLTGNGAYSGAGFIQLSGNVNATARGTINWAGGQVSSGSSLAIATNGTLNILTTGIHDLPGTALNNAGVVVWSAGQIRGGLGTAINNSGLWNVQTDDVIGGNVFGGSSTFTNSGTFRKSVTTGATTLNSIAFNTTGTIDLQTGTVNLAGGLTGNGVFSGSGLLQVSGDVNVTVHGTMNWAGGQFNQNSSFTVATNGALNILGGGIHDLPASILSNAGVVVWSSGQIRGGLGMVINNSGLWNIQTDDTISGNVYGGSSAFTNSGTFRKSLTSGATALSGISFNNLGTVDLQSGSLSLGSSGIQTAGITKLNGGSLSLSEPFQLLGGSLTGTNTITGTVTNNGVVKPGGDFPGLLTITGSYIQTPQGELDLQIGGTTVATGYDQLAVGGAITLDGALDVTLIDPFVPVQGSSFHVLTFSSRTGDFAAINGLVIFTNLALQATYSSTALDLVAATTNSPATIPTIVSQPLGKTIINGETASFSITAAGTRPLYYQWQLNQTNLSGQNSATLTLLNAQTNASGDYRVVVTNSAGSVTSSVATLVVRPVSDLVITDIANPTNGFATQPVTFTWRSLNQGSQSALAPWTESIGISTNANGSFAMTIASINASSNLAANQSIVRTQSVILPSGLEGTFYVVLTTDTGNQVVEEDNETNNVTISTIPLAIHSPDLRPTSIAAPSSAQFGQTVSVSWTVTNSGASPTFSTWSDRVFLSGVSNDLSGATLLTAVSVTNVPFAAFASLTNNASVSLPLSQNFSSGNYFLVVGVDGANNISETNEANNLLSVPISIALPPLPDLAPLNVSAPANVQPGATIPISWIITNSGSLSITSVWSETVFLGTNNLGAGAAELGTFQFTNTLASGSSLVRTQMIAVPIDSSFGTVWFLVQVDSRNDIFESNESNNLVAATNSTLIPAVLTLQFSATQVFEGATSLTGIVTRNGSRASPLTVTLTNNDLTELSLPAQVIIPAGQASVGFSATPLHDGIVDGPQSVTATASAPGFNPASAQLTVLDVDHPNLGLTFESNSVVEGLTLMGTVTRDGGTNSTLAVNLSSSNPGRLMIPPEVIITQGAFSTVFTVLAVDDATVQLPTVFTVTAFATNCNNGSANVTVLDNDLPGITLMFASTNISEGGGPQATMATLQRSPIASAPLYVELATSNGASLVVPSLVTIPASQGSVTFPIGAIDNHLLDGTRTVEVDPWIKTSALGARVAEATPVFVNVTDDDGPALQLSVANVLLGKGKNPATTGTVARNTVTNSALVVNLSSSDTTQLAVPATVTIPVGATSAAFNIATLDDGVSGGSKSVTVTASAVSFSSAAAPVTVSDLNLPDLIVQTVNAPTNATTETFVNLGYTILNQGLGAMASNTIVQSIYLSPDTLPGDGTLMGDYTFSGGLPVGAQFGQSFAIMMPQVPGDYWVVVQTDVSNAVAEILEDNNTRVSAFPLHLSAAYDAVVATTLQSAPANTTVPLTGRAFKPGNLPAPFALVNIHINVRGTHRVFSVITDASGNFATTWQPLPGEAGFYEIGAAHPGFTNAPAQASFSLYGMNAVPTKPSVLVLGANSSTGAVQIVNAGDLPLSSVTAQVVSPPANLNFSVSLAANSTAGLASNALNYTISSTDGQPANGTVLVHLTSAEGASFDVPFAISVKSLVPQLSTSPSQLIRGMKRGAQSFASFVVTNIGGATSGPITISLPALPWLSLTSTNPLPSLAPGEGATISLQLNPGATLPFGDITGNIVLSAAGNLTAVPFDFRVLSDAKGDFLLNTKDEFTYYAVGAPPLTNAAATLSDATTGAVITNGVTDSNGQWRVSQLPEGYYNLEVAADKHSSYQGTTLLTAGVTNSVDAFLSRQTVTYTWTVEPTEVEDHYKIVVQTEFEANVPAPVVTIDPSVIDLSDMVGSETQVNLTIQNHGLIAAQNFELQFDDHPNVTFEPLISSISTLPPKSTYTIPLIIRRANESSSALKANGLIKPKDVSGVASCFATGRGIDNFQCGPNLNIQVTTLTFPNAGTCLSELIPSFGWLPGGGGGGGRRIYCVDCGQRPPPPGIPYTWGPSTPGNGSNHLLDLLLAAIYKATPALAIPNPCDPECLPKLIPVIVNCFMPDDDGPPSCLDNSADCLPLLSGHPSDVDVINCMAVGLTCVFDKAKEKTHTECLFDILEACAPEEDNAKILKPNGLAQPKALTFSGPYAGLLGTLQTRVDRVVAVNNYFDYYLGDSAWTDTGDQTTVHALLAQFNAAIAPGSDAGTTISSAELAGLLALPLPAGVTTDTINHLAARWNRSIAYWHAGIFKLSDVPNGQSTDFLAVDQLNNVTSLATNALQASKAEGFTTLQAGIRGAVGDIVDAISAPQGGTCAHVKLQLTQDAVLSRDAFKATLQIDNTEGQSLQNLYVTLGVFDTNGNDASALFGIKPPTLTGITGTNGNGSLPTDMTGSLSWTLVPTVDAAPTNVTRYFVSGGLNYTVNGNTVSVPLAPSPINVYPSPRLTVEYFHQRDVYADDPFTDIVEPSIPFSLAVMVKNNGQGTAKDFRITSAQPQIVDNEKGLLIDFKIIATEVAGQNLQPTLTADLGDIAPGTNAIARWLMTSTLQGLFIDYSASFEHVDDLGNPKTSLIDEVTIHEMIHPVQAGGAFEDGRPDFLVNDVPDLHDFPDTLYLSDGSTNGVLVVTNDTITGTLSPGTLHVQLDASVPGGWVYLNVPDPGNGLYRLTGIMRSDNVPVTLDTNAWVTDRTFIGLGKAPVRENILHLLDYNSTGTYTLTYVPNPATDTTPPTSSVAVLPADSSVGIPLHWSGQDDSSGIVSYDIYASENGGAFQQWLAGVANTTAIYQGTLGKSYSFYSVAVDAAGNREAAPSTPDAVTTVTRTNHAPQITTIADQTIIEGNTLSLTLAASDPDGDGLTLALGAGAPPGIQLDPHSGALTWVTGEGNGPSTNNVSVIATDTGIPPMNASRTFQIIVLESNSPPVLAPIADVTISEEEMLAITNVATDSDLPAQQLTFSFATGVPAGVSLDSHTGVFNWQPTDLQGGTTNVFKIVVTDNGPPPLSATQSFSVIVVDSQPDIVMNIGSTQMLVGSTASVPLRLVTGADLTNVTMLLNVNNQRLTNFALSDFAAQVASVQIQSVASNQYQLRFQSQPNARLQGDFAMASLGFGTTASSNSAVALLGGEQLSGLRASSVTPLTGVVRGGRVFVIGTQPILDVSSNINQQLALTIYGLPGKRYSLESFLAFGGTNTYSVEGIFNVNSLRTDLPLVPMSPRAKFFRAEQLADSNVALNLQSGQLAIDWPLEWSSHLWPDINQLNTNAVWMDVVAQPSTVGGEWHLSLPASATPRFYRIVLP